MIPSATHSVYMQLPPSVAHISAPPPPLPTRFPLPTSAFPRAMLFVATCGLEECRGCSRQMGIYDPRHDCPLCRKGPFCSKCINNGAVTILGVPQSPWEVRSSCPTCFRRTVTLDLEQAVDVYEPATSPPGADGLTYGATVTTTLLLLHGEGRCRTSLKPLAQRLARDGFRCVVPDLPGHGSLLSMPVTMDNCMTLIADVLVHYGSFMHVALESSAAASDLAPPSSSVGASQLMPPPVSSCPVVVFGVELGGYLAMEYIGRNPYHFSAAVISAAARNTGRGAGLGTMVALEMLRRQPFVWAEHLVRRFVQDTTDKLSKYLDRSIVESCLIEPGVYFGQSAAVAKLLRECDTEGSMHRFYNPVLYLSGSSDLSDVQDTLRTIAQHNERSKKHFQRHALAAVSKTPSILDAALPSVTTTPQPITTTVVGTATNAAAAALTVSSAASNCGSDALLQSRRQPALSSSVVYDKVTTQFWFDCRCREQFEADVIAFLQKVQAQAATGDL